MAKLTKEDVGCHADGVFGHAHVRAGLARLLDSYCANLPQAVLLISELRGEMSDDASEEDDAIDLLNREACAEDVHLELCDGDLILVSDADRCPDCGAGEGHFQSCPANL